MTAAMLLGATRGTIVSYANSADVAVGDPARAVGYGAVVFTAGERGSDTSALTPQPAPKDAPLTAADKKALLQLARETLWRYLNTETLPLARGLDPKLQRERGVFVTLKKRGDLRGCIGNITGGAPLCRLVSMMALEAALNDPRFSKVQPKELDSRPDRSERRRRSSSAATVSSSARAAARRCSSPRWPPSRAGASRRCSTI
jgi:hypothetical protein